ncbi:cell wall-binding repeat-containing protein [Euzebya rosea]|uniref:cell wall-binding repeat-containing protein n=1 Tax=Euzebya rosea TaxID=2052804 RepID=UPI000D3E906E|nr:cell wall-binding repeat-containing protein [Euzebya rosea]
MTTPTAIKTLLSMLLVLVLGVSTVALAQDPVDDPAEDTTDPTDEESEPEEEESEPEEEESEPEEEESEDESDDESDDDESDDDRQVRGARVFGADRISTAVAISQYEFRGGASEVYLARADNFADAVAAGALQHGPVLLVPSCGELPPIVAEEVARLHPHKVVALGGPNAICDDILDAAIAAASAGRGHDDDDDDDDNDDEIGDDEPRTEETTYLDLAVGEQATLDAAEIGTVTIERTETGVSLVDAVAVDDTWTVTVEDDEVDEVHVRFRNGDTRVDLGAEIEDEQVRVRVRTRQD